MAHEDYGREPRWNTAGYWTDRQARERRPENENREGDRSLSRNYSREDMRRYASRSVDQSKRMRKMRGGREPWDSQLDTDQIGLHDQRALDFERYRGSDWGQDRDYRPQPGRVNREQMARGQSQRPGHRSQRLEQGPGWARPPRMGRQPGERWNRDAFYNQRPDNDYDSQPGKRASRNRFRDDDFDYDAERDYRGYHTGRDMNLEGPGSPGREMRDPYRNRDFTRDPNQARSRGRSYAWDRARNSNAPGRDTARDTYDNFWGRRQQGRRYRIRNRGAWWNNEGGRGDVTSARSYGGDIATGPNFDWLEDRDYDFDPGYDYEFGTDFDFLNDVPAESQKRQARRQNQPPPRGAWAAFEYGWQGSPDRLEARYREVWNLPGPYAGMGPQGYSRSDEAILDEICEIFTRNGQINASGIDIQVNNGQVTLDGDVDRKDEKYLAEDIASSISGVKEITNHLRVQAHSGARSMGREETVRIGRIQPGMRVAGVDGKNIGQVRETHNSGFILNRESGGAAFIPYRTVKRTNGQIILHVHGNEIDRQGWKE